MLFGIWFYHQALPCSWNTHSSPSTDFLVISLRARKKLIGELFLVWMWLQYKLLPVSLCLICQTNRRLFIFLFFLDAWQIHFITFSLRVFGGFLRRVDRWGSSLHRCHWNRRTENIENDVENSERIFSSLQSRGTVWNGKTVVFVFLSLNKLKLHTHAWKKTNWQTSAAVAPGTSQKQSI